jgi:hypothetical protein
VDVSFYTLVKTILLYYKWDVDGYRRDVRSCVILRLFYSIDEFVLKRIFTTPAVRRALLLGCGLQQVMCNSSLRKMG